MSRAAVLITGGTSGIGLATAALLHDRGVQVMVSGSTEESAAAARRELPDDVIVVRADAASLGDTTRLISEAKAAFGKLTGLFLNAGIFAASPLDSVDEATWDRLFSVNAKGQFFTLQKASPLLAEGASVVLTVGIGATRGIATSSIAAGSRGALLAMVPSLAIELAPRNIRVNAISPGAIDTPIIAKSGVPHDQVAHVKRAMAEAVPLGRLGEAHEVAAAVAFLLSDEAAYISGENLVVGGGAGLRV